MTLLRVRVELHDVPGALAGVTSSLAALSVDVAAVDVLEVDGRTVVDELLLRLPPGITAQDVDDALRMAGAVDVLSTVESKPAADAAVRAFELVRGVLSCPGDADAAGLALARSAYADAGTWVDAGAAGRYPLARRALEEGVPSSGRAGPDASPLALPSGWVLWVAPQVPEVRQLVVVGRRLNVRFSATEAARLRSFATLLDVVGRLAV